MKKYRIEIRQTADDNDSNNFWIYKNNANRWSGFGYQSKDTNELFLKKCPNCHLENYMSQKICYNCNFDPNILLNEE